MTDFLGEDDVLRRRRLALRIAHQMAHLPRHEAISLVLQLLPTEELEGLNGATLAPAERPVDPAEIDNVVLAMALVVSAGGRIEVPSRIVQDIRSVVMTMEIDSRTGSAVYTTRRTDDD